MMDDGDVIVDGDAWPTHKICSTSNNLVAAVSHFKMLLIIRNLWSTM